MLGAFGVFLIMMSGFLVESPPSEEIVEPEQTSIIELKEELEGILKRIEGVGEVTILVTFEEMSEYVYAKEEKITDEQTEADYILMNTEEGEKPLVLKEIPPKVKGVVVVCEGAESAVVQQSILEVLKASLDISYTQVSIQKMVA